MGAMWKTLLTAALAIALSGGAASANDPEIIETMPDARQIEYVRVTPAGLIFYLEGAVFTGCGNSFLVDIDLPNYGVTAATVLSAYANDHYVKIRHSNKPGNCQRSVHRRLEVFTNWPAS